MTSLRLSGSPPCSATIESYASVAGLPRAFNHGFMPGGKRPESKLRHFRYSGELGSGRATYRRARKSLLDWRMHDGSESTGIWHDGDIVVTWARLLPGIFVLNPCAALRLPSARSETSVGYATTAGHLIAGHERMTVRRRRDGSVTFEVESYSRGAGWLGRAIFPLLASSQQRYFGEQVRCMQALAAA